MKILLAVDGSEYTRRMLDYLAAHKELFERRAGYVAINVAADLPGFVARYFSKADLCAYYQSEAELVIAPVRELAAQQGWDIDCIHACGHAGDVIARTAAQGDYDLLMMGSHGHSAIAGLALGSVTARVLAQCKTPMLIVR